MKNASQTPQTPASPPRTGSPVTGADMSDRSNILFLCTGNSARMQRAETILTREGIGRFQAKTAGTSADSGPDPRRTLTVSAGRVRHGVLAAEDLW